MSLEKVAKAHRDADGALAKSFLDHFNPLLAQNPPSIQEVVSFMNQRLELVLHTVQLMANEIVAGRIREEDDVAGE